MYYLRELERRDLSIINGWRNNPKVIALLGAPFRYINAEVDEAWFDAYMRNRGNAVRCTIIHEETGQAIGLVSLTNINHLNQSAEFHIMVGEAEKQNCGAGTFAVHAMLSHAFYNMNLNRIELTVLSSNGRAQHVYEKCGFQKEGILRQAYFKQGLFEDAYRYSILRSEYNRLKDICPPPTRYISSFCIEKLPKGRGRGRIIQEFDSVFLDSVTQRSNFSDTLEKINKYAVFLIAHGRDTFGYAAFYCNDYHNKIAFLTLIGVARKYQHQHVGSSLLWAIEKISLENGMLFLKLEVSKRNRSAISFYCRNGFKKIENSSNSTFYMIKRLKENYA